ncbi:hypothetical protein PMAYCL1PPCAC_25043 [Pristionchus mayeri]|uniref:ZZ-type domain-containing protein n=1 Tax=Pristionchus mayeri TaxID=1317129 RepID=A0AAN5D1L4_9BILA|nr:hypothetical protein PMAYCL1PPCAC_25043 [Pristionchus mayeri]
MADTCEKSDNAITAEYQEKLAKQEAIILALQTELKNTTNSFRTALGLKNQKIRELEEQNSRPKAEKQEEFNITLTYQMENMQSKLDNMDRTLNSNARVFKEHCSALASNAARMMESQAKQSENIFGEERVDVTDEESAASWNGLPCLCDGRHCYLAPSNGGRYKCTICNDFDLCSVCFGKSRHPNHVFIHLRDSKAEYPPTIQVSSMPSMTPFEPRPTLDS